MASASSQELPLFTEAGLELSANQPGAQEGMTAQVPVRNLPELPPELKQVAKSLEKAMHDPGSLPGAFSNFCGAAYVKPDWAGYASEYLAALFDEQEDTLAEMTRIPDLIIELGSGHYTLTFMVASRWAAKADLARLTRLAEALIATQSKMRSPEVVDLMLALTTSLAISRYSRAEQLLSAAEPYVPGDDKDALLEAQLWLDAGCIVRGCTQEARELWDQRLRRPRVAWTWEGREECAALAQLSDCLDTGYTAATLFKAVVPAGWWDLLVVREKERAVHENALAAAKAYAKEQREQRPEEVPHEQPRQIVRQPIIIWRGIPFFVGGLVGAWALLLGIWISPFDLERTPTQPVAQTVSPSATVPAASSAKTVQASSTVHPHAAWRKEQTASLAAEVPELRAWVEKIEIGEWPAYESLLKGQTPQLPQEDARYQKLLLWLHLDPPSNAEIRRQVPLLLAELRQDSTVIELWEKLVYPGSLNAGDIQAAALRTQHDKKDAWSATQRFQLASIAKRNIASP
ncbi:hypothetical protein EI77_04448 [Prosthecobacter fusiformis]|uniref:Uncharacterized protein n=2 Tax=Prosthecobacter fusiformis TaxID=48464 RepID=A0A4R7RIF8_9BACT|nr:hypothetical protein EI77_04448 [Prosthecobacter fusiformis]